MRPWRSTATPETAPDCQPRARGLAAKCTASKGNLGEASIRTRRSASDFSFASPSILFSCPETCAKNARQIRQTRVLNDIRGPSAHKRAAVCPAVRQESGFHEKKALPDRTPSNFKLNSAMSGVLSKGRDEIKTVEIHYFVPGRNEVLDKFSVRVGTSIDLGERAELGVRAEDKIGSRCRPPDFS